METIVKVGEFNYRVGKLNAITQFHITRRLAPILAAMGISVAQLKKAQDLDLGDFVGTLGPVSEVLAAMSDDDANYIIFNCLAAIAREQGEGKWAPVTTQGQLLFADIEMTVMLRLVVETLKLNLAGFLPGLGVEIA